MEASFGVEVVEALATEATELALDDTPGAEEPDPLAFA